MKNVPVISAVLIILLTTFLTTQAQDHTKYFTMKRGKYRQMFYLDQAKKTSVENYKLDTTITDTSLYGKAITVMILGSRDGDQFSISVSELKTRTLIMRQTFYMSGFKDDDDAITSWFLSRKRGELDEFLLDYFGIVVKPRKQFIREQQDLLKKTSAVAGSFY